MLSSLATKNAACNKYNNLKQFFSPTTVRWYYLMSMLLVVMWFIISILLWQANNMIEATTSFCFMSSFLWSSISDIQKGLLCNLSKSLLCCWIVSKLTLFFRSLNVNWFIMYYNRIAIAFSNQFESLFRVVQKNI